MNDFLAFNGSSNTGPSGVTSSFGGSSLLNVNGISNGLGLSGDVDVGPIASTGTITATGPAVQSTSVSATGRAAITTVLGFDPGADNPAYLTYDTDRFMRNAPNQMPDSLREQYEEYVENASSEPGGLAFVDKTGQGRAYYNDARTMQFARDLDLSPDQYRDYVAAQEVGHKIGMSHPSLRGKITDAENEIIGDAISAEMFPEQALFTNINDIAMHAAQGGGQRNDSYGQRHELVGDAVGEWMAQNNVGPANATADERFDHMIQAYGDYLQEANAPGPNGMPPFGPDGMPPAAINQFRAFLTEYAAENGNGMSADALNTGMQNANRDALQSEAREIVDRARNGGTTS